MSEQSEHFADIKHKLLRSEDLPTIPALHQKILKLVKTDNYSVDEVGDLIERDHVLASKLLKLVNSPFYGLFGHIASVSRGIMLLGANVIHGFVMSATLFDAKDSSLLGLWDHSYCCSSVAGYIAKRLDMKSVEDTMTGALLHDLGKVLIRRQLPEETLEIEEASRSKRITTLEAEKKVLDMSHDEVGVWLADHWNLPGITMDIIGFHHKPSLCSKHPKETAIVHLSDIIVKGIGVTGSADSFVPELDEAGLNNLGLAEEDVLDIVDEVVYMVEDDEMFSNYLTQ